MEVWLADRVNRRVARSRNEPWIKSFGIGTMMFMAVFSSPAAADRHCSPATDYYFQSRAELLKDELDCPTRISASLRLLLDARNHAADCGCPNLEAVISQHLEARKNPNVECETNVQEVFDLEEKITRLYEDCV